MWIDTLFFYFFALLVLGGGVATITCKSAVHSAISLIVSMVGVAGLFLLQHAEFLFAVQIVLYIGGVMVLFLFVIMLVNLDESMQMRQFNRQWLLAVAAVIAAGVQAVWLLSKPADLPAAVPQVPGGPGNVQRVADVLFSQYLLPFEIASVLLLAAVIGSVVMAKKRL
ncbi:MAG TPA: NADH-quinone oxidoreductase subunit J [Bryobacteraceae bacterium]|nr:NADH-quinone oxidoreductase subunit J [Bryobacteraceae bacterium]HPU70545.1 NADH-quinone oxidoreductase subunit J [Bryobacteraceae bacterium]